MVNYERDSDDDDEHTDEEEEEEGNNEEQDGDDDQSNSNSAVILYGAGESEFVQIETIAFTDQTIVTSDLLNVTPVCIINLDLFIYLLFVVQSRRIITNISY